VNSSTSTVLCAFIALGAAMSASITTPAILVGLIIPLWG
jgi:hypothetical protein